MKKLSFDYLGYSEKPVQDKEDLFKSGIPAASKLRSMTTTMQRLFKTTSKNILLYLVGDDWFKFEIYSSESNSKLISIFYFNMNDSRLDLYSSENTESPILVWLKKQCVLKNIGITLETMSVESVFLPIVSYT